MADAKKPPPAEVEALARRMWNAYRGTSYGYLEWELLLRGCDSKRGMRAVARMVLREYAPRKTAKRRK